MPVLPFSAGSSAGSTSMAWEGAAAAELDGAAPSAAGAAGACSPAPAEDTAAAPSVPSACGTSPLLVGRAGLGAKSSSSYTWARRDVLSAGLHPAVCLPHVMWHCPASHPSTPGWQLQASAGVARGGAPSAGRTASRCRTDQSRSGTPAGRPSAGTAAVSLAGPTCTAARPHCTPLGWMRLRRACSLCGLAGAWQTGQR